MSGHILHAFTNSLERMRQDVLTMAAHAETNVGNSLKGLLERQLELCNAVIADDDEVDQLEIQCDRDAVEIIAKFSPVAKDLRRVLAEMKFSQQLERISDEAVNIAKRAKKIIANPPIPETLLVQPIGNLAIGMLADAVKAFRERDVRLALSISSRDQALDDAHSDFIKNLVKRTEEDLPHIKDYIDLMFIVRFLERIGDHAVNLAEDIVFMETSYDIRHGGALPDKI